MTHWLHHAPAVEKAAAYLLAVSAPLLMACIGIVFHFIGKPPAEPKHFWPRRRWSYRRRR